MTDGPVLPWRYRHSGLLVGSQIELEAWKAFRTEDEGEPDVAIVTSDERCPDCPTDGGTATDIDGVRFAIEGVGGWQVQEGRRILLHPSLSADPRELQLFTLGSAWGLLGYQRGQAMWHGSAVELDGRCVLFCGEAGEGKSTMAAAMIASGATLVADDLSRAAPGEGTALIYPSSSRLKLWSQAIDHLGWRDRIIVRDWLRDDKFHCRVPAHHAGGGAMPLDAIVVLQSGSEPALDQLTGGTALAAVLAGTIYRPEALEEMGLWAEQGAIAAKIAAQAPVYRLTRPRDLAALGESVNAVTEMLKSLG
ncbi:hypothetical protein Q9K02_06025 [Qipengyuania sp. G39]|uniref:HPr kinase n=1 Tax=Qipengyuania profundimaris TaxID=3067652 RepID=A0ABT9HNH6_9SPHN|nr:hypothetical protein [Qipengyuania sp. G39]MDP4574695.1 hypothetical protein [Qipengyuania sp. G39]